MYLNIASIYCHTTLWILMNISGLKKSQPTLYQIIKKKRKAVGILIHAFITMSTIDYTWRSITNNQQQIVQDVQLLSWWAGLHPSTTALLIMLSNSVALFPSNYINTLQFLLANLKFSFYWKHVFFFPLEIDGNMLTVCI